MDKAERFDALTGGFGNLYVLMSASAFVFQLLFTSRIHRRLGIGFAMRVLPIAMLLGTSGIFLAVAVFPGILLNVCRLLKIGENGLRYSLDQATRELLFFPVPAGVRLKAKAYIDVFVQRSAKAGAGILLLPVTFGWASGQREGVFEAEKFKADVTRTPIPRYGRGLCRIAKYHHDGRDDIEPEAIEQQEMGNPSFRVAEFAGACKLFRNGSDRQGGCFCSAKPPRCGRF